MPCVVDEGISPAAYCIPTANTHDGKNTQTVNASVWMQSLFIWQFSTQSLQQKSTFVNLGGANKATPSFHFGQFKRHLLKFMADFRMARSSGEFRSLSESTWVSPPGSYHCTGPILSGQDIIHSAATCIHADAGQGMPWLLIGPVQATASSWVWTGMWTRLGSSLSRTVFK